MNKDYCNYWCKEWRKRFDGIKTMFYETKIDGNTLYVIRRRSFLDRILRKPERPAVCTIIMCNLKESILIEKLKEYGFTVGE